MLMNIYKKNQITLTAPSKPPKTASNKGQKSSKEIHVPQFFQKKIHREIVVISALNSKSKWILSYQIAPNQ